nr:hypothetical protein [Tanacetum cinerariifolium]
MVPAATPDCRCRISAPPNLTTTVSHWHRNQGPPSFEAHLLNGQVNAKLRKFVVATLFLISASLLCIINEWTTDGLTPLKFVMYITDRRSSIEAIHLIRSLLEKYMERQRDLHLASIDLEKAVEIRPAILYRSECWPITKALANRIEVAELRMLRWTYGKTMLDMIPNGVYRAGHVRRRPQLAPVGRVKELAVDGIRRRVIPKLR